MVIFPEQANLPRNYHSLQTILPEYKPDVTEQVEISALLGYRWWNVFAANEPSVDK